MDDKELKSIFDGSEDAINEMKRVFKEHEEVETVIVEPNSWVGKALLIQTKRLIDLRRDVNSLTSSINLLNKKIAELLNDFRRESRPGGREG
ncbi:MAG: hypothetical protein H0Z35_13650 [Thermoanaerobacteraceae bacterium]|nr:hypothetical protein [Thermoanaerobacteraceae bacterium]